MDSQEIKQIIREKEDEIKEDEIDEILTVVEKKARGFVHDCGMRAAYNYWWNDGASQGYATDSEVMEDAKRLHITGDSDEDIIEKTISHYSELVDWLIYDLAYEYTSEG